VPDERGWPFSIRGGSRPLISSINRCGSRFTFSDRWIRFSKREANVSASFTKPIAESFGAMDGVHVKVVSERAGHANVSITLGVYAAFVPTLQADAAAGVDAWLRQNLAEQVGDKWVTIRPFRPKRKELSD
jgi:hypothetical protein